MREKINTKCCFCGKSIVREIEIPYRLPKSIKEDIRRNPSLKGIYPICEDCPPKTRLVECGSATIEVTIEGEPTMYCPECGHALYATGACYNSKEKSGYQCYCEVCGIWWTQGIDGNYYKDRFLTTVYKPGEIGSDYTGDSPEKKSESSTTSTVNVEVEYCGIDKGAECPKCHNRRVEVSILHFDCGCTITLYDCLDCDWSCSFPRTVAHL